MSFHAIVPMLCVAAAGIAAMVAEAFRSPGERMPIAPLGAIGLNLRNYFSANEIALFELDYPAQTGFDWICGGVDIVTI